MSMQPVFNTNRERTNRFGRIFVDASLIRNADEQMLYEITCMLPLFPIRCEHVFASDTFEITALSPLFDPLKADEEIPLYRVEIIMNGEHEGENRISLITVERMT